VSQVGLDQAKSQLQSVSFGGASSRLGESEILHHYVACRELFSHF
jgi:hypothetical protein